MLTVQKYKGYEIKQFEDGSFDIEQDGELIDDDFSSEHECKNAIDGYSE